MVGCDWFCGGCGAISGLPGGGGVDVLCPKSRNEWRYATRASRSVYSALRSMCCIGLFLGAEEGILDVCVDVLSLTRCRDPKKGLRVPIRMSDKQQEKYKFKSSIDAFLSSPQKTSRNPSGFDLSHPPPATIQSQPGRGVV